MRVPIALNIQVCEGDFTLNQNRVDLLEAIIKYDSINGAARHLQISYKHAWDSIHDMNQSFKEPLVVTDKGGFKGGGSSVTEQGQRVLSTYRNILRKSRKAVSKDLKEIYQSLQSAESTGH